jgi:hypothetical protein
MKMSQPIFSGTRTVNRLLGVVGIFFSIATIFLFVAAQMRMGFWSPDRTYIPVGITGMHHMGTDFSVTEFYVNGYSGSNVGREGGGGSNYCCVLLPERWRGGLVAELRWSVADWSKEKKEETQLGIYQSITLKCFKAYVPIEKYFGTPGQLYIHFFSKGGAWIISSDVGSGATTHPIPGENSPPVQAVTFGAPCDKKS